MLPGTQVLAKRWIEIQGLFDDTINVEVAQRHIDQQSAQRLGQIEQDKNQAVEAAQTQRTQREQAAEQEHQSKLAQISRDHSQSIADLQNAHNLSFDDIDLSNNGSGGCDDDHSCVGVIAGRSLNGFTYDSHTTNLDGDITSVTFVLTAGGTDYQLVFNSSGGTGGWNLYWSQGANNYSLVVHDGCCTADGGWIYYDTSWSSAWCENADGCVAHLPFDDSIYYVVFEVIGNNCCHAGGDLCLPPASPVLCGGNSRHYAGNICQTCGACAGCCWSNQSKIYAKYVVRTTYYESNDGTCSGNVVFEDVQHIEIWGGNFDPVYEDWGVRRAVDENGDIIEDFAHFITMDCSGGRPVFQIRSGPWFTLSVEAEGDCNGLNQSSVECVPGYFWYGDQRVETELIFTITENDHCEQEGACG